MSEAKYQAPEGAIEGLWDDPEMIPGLAGQEEEPMSVEKKSTVGRGGKESTVEKQGGEDNGRTRKF